MYTVEWKSLADQELAAIWLDAPDRDAVTRASHRIEQELKLRPLQVGRSRVSSVQRIIIRSPLGIEYEVIEDDKKVIVRVVYTVA